jgi:hypothetical protein
LKEGEIDLRNGDILEFSHKTHRQKFLLIVT